MNRKNIIRVVALIIVIGVAYMVAKTIGLLWIGIMTGMIVVAGIIYRNKKLQTIKVESENKLFDPRR